MYRPAYTEGFRLASGSEDVADCKQGRVVRRLNPVLDLESECLTESCQAKWDVGIPVEEDGGIATLPGAVINANPADHLRRQRRFASETEPCVGDACGVKCSESGKQRQAAANVMREKGRRFLSVDAGFSSPWRLVSTNILF